jgi:myo-inositol-1(or 4)-monophosphatase
MKIRTKESLRDIVTDFDTRIEKVIFEILQASGHKIIGEESFSGEFDTPGEPVWVVDSIDGTANFVSGMPLYAASVGLCQNEKFLIGAVGLPATKELFFTHGDSAAFLNGKLLSPTPTDMKNALIAVSFSGAKGEEEFRRREFQLFGTINDSSRGCLRLGSAATNICYVALGRLQAAYGFQAQIWDVAAGLAIAERAGCQLHTMRRKNSTKIDYIVGAPDVVKEIHVLWQRFEMIRPEVG